MEPGCMLAGAPGECHGRRQLARAAFLDPSIDKIFCKFGDDFGSFHCLYRV